MKKIIAAAALAGFSMAASAAVLFENAVVGSVGGNNHFTYDATLGAENFSLASGTLIDKISFNAYHSPSSQMISSVDWSIRSSLGATPGGVLASGTSAYTNALVTTLSGYDLLDYILDIPDLSVAAGNYWVTFHLNGNQGDPHWTLTSVGDGLSGFSNNNGASWGGNYPGGNMAFRIEGGNAVPEPSSLALLGLSLFGVVAARRRK